MGLPDLLQQLNQVVFRYQTSQNLKRLTILWLIAGSLTLLTFTFLEPIAAPYYQHLFLAVLLGVPCLVAIGMLLFRFRSRVSPASRHQIATLIEQTYPDLDTSLLATLELEKTTDETLPTFLQNRLIQQVIQHGTEHDWRQTISNRRLILQSTTHLVCFTAWFISCLTCWFYLKAAPIPKGELQTTIASTQAQFQVEIKPGTTDLEKNHPLLITARFTEKIPDIASLHIRAASGETQKLPLVKHLDDPVFAARLTDVSEDLTYSVQVNDWESETYQVKVYVLPKLVQLDSMIIPPNYTGLPTRTVEDSLTISAITGSKIAFIAKFNKPVKQAQLKTGTGKTLPMEVSSDGFVARLRFLATESQSWNLRIIDADERENRAQPFIDLTVIPNLPPEIKVTFPGRDTRVSPLEEALVQGTVVDDFGVQQVGLVYSIPGQSTQTLKLLSTAKPKQEVATEHLLSLEQLQVQPDTLISYHLFAEDIAPDGSRRKVLSDMYFMEVRHFEEIFKQGRSANSSSKSGKSGGNAQQAEKLAEQQKQIINATWKIIRREIKETVSSQYAEDVNTLQQAQQALVTAVINLASKVKSQKSKAVIDSISQKMQETVSLLNAAKDANEVEQLTAALATEQASYQLLLKLRAREHKVSQNKNGGGSKGGGSSRSQNQLQQLELTNKKQRYETENQASQPPAAQPNRESLQILNRLRELAQRQKDLNEQLKELADKQRFAKTDQEREEIERQLKRLRERQRELLRKADEVAQRMDQSKQPSSTKSRRELEQTRKHLQQSSQSLKEGQVSRALNSGTRAQQQLNQLKNEFRKKTANQFADAMRSLNQQAEQLDQKQKELNQALNKSNQPDQAKGRRSLRKNQGQQKLADQLEKQEDRLKNLVEQMKKVVKESEKSEPLLSKHLYDAIRKTRPYRPEDALKNAANFLKEGATERAQQAEQRAGQGIEKMKQGIKVAAESVLGNDLESLKRARQEIKSLTSEMKQEQKLAGNPQAAGQPKQAAQKTAQSGKGKSPGQKPSPGTKSGQPGKSGSPSGQGKSPVQLASAQKGKGQGSQSGSGKSSSPSNSQSSSKSTSSKSLKGSRGSPKGGPGGGQGGPGAPSTGPITGNQFREWSDRMRDVEEMVGDSELRSKVAQIRERAQSMRAEFKRHSKVPEGDLVNAQILEPLAELQKVLSNEISKRGAQTSLAPIDRDPVPEKYSELVRRYYEELGSGK
ncbi:hypothetical protein Enr17x_25420 [Gimesia fumaroli]|uniref:Uncharacterized protein n=2 Tax=Gimesia fumaroli TaxID=2527976 RepID=A0A518IBM3_9PLAN|nr:hypothetical protein Enr17x_25420 [Gimesia fumaroli]